MIKLRIGGIDIREYIRNFIITKLKPFEWGEIQQGHGWYKENEIMFLIYDNETSYSYDCPIEIYYIDEKFEFFERASVYSSIKLGINTLEELNEYLKNND